MDSDRCLAGTEIFLNKEKHGLYLYCYASSGLTLTIWLMSSASYVALLVARSLAFVRANSLALLRSETRRLSKAPAWAVPAAAGMRLS